MILCIDTATQTPGVTLVVDGKATTAFLESGRVADTLLLKVDELLVGAGGSARDLTGVIVLIGPGSFTGLRVGLAVANQFAHQLKLPIIGLKTDEFWAFRVGKKDALFLQSMNRDEVYTAEGIRPIKEITALKGQLWVGELTPAHREELHELQEFKEIIEYDETWLQIIDVFKREFSNASQKKYQLLEPYYGKDPNITTSKKS